MLDYCYKEKKPNGTSPVTVKASESSDANNVQVSVLHVMNVNHTEKRLSTCSKKDEASKKAGHRCFRFQMAEEIRSFEKLDGI